MEELDDGALRRLADIVREAPLESVPAPEGFDLLEVVGEGGMGTVHRAMDRRLQRTVALKVGRRASLDCRRRFEQEARITARLEHPNVPPVFASGQLVDGRPYYAMRLVAGTNLRELVRRAHESQSAGERTPSLLRIVSTVCDVVHYAHTRSIVHRDLKPENVLIGDLGEVWVVDWGLGRILGGNDGGRPVNPTTLASAEVPGVRTSGTPMYMAPEQARGERDFSRVTTDVYALGCLVLEVITGRPPFAGEGDARILERLRAGETPALPAATKASRPLVRIARKALAPRPQERYASARALANDLRRFQDGLPVAAYREGVAERAWRGLRRHRVAAALVVTYVAVRLSMLLGLGV